MSEEYTKEQAICILNLLSHDTMRENGVKTYPTFEMGGRVFKCDYHSAVERFAKNDPNGDFLVWCQNNLKEL